MTAPTCTGPDCPRPVYAAGLCRGHYAQRTRHPGEPLAPLRPRGAVRLVVRLQPGTIAALAARGPTAPQAARAVLEEWLRGGHLPEH